MRIFRSTLGVLVLSLLTGPLFCQANSVSLIGSNTTIDQSGSYALSHNLIVNSAGPAVISITASGVSLDLNGFEITGPGTNSGVGIMISGVSGVEVFNGRLSNLGFGVVVSNSSNVTIHDLSIRALNLSVTTPPPETGVMIVESTGVSVDRNNLQDVGLGIFVRGGKSHGNRITNNNIAAGSHGLLGICYNPAPNDPAGPSGDFVADNSIFGFATGISITATAGPSVFKENSIFYTNMAIAANGVMVQSVNNIMVMLN